MADLVLRWFGDVDADADADEVCVGGVQVVGGLRCVGERTHVENGFE